LAGFNYKIEGISAKFYVGLFVLIFVVYLILPLPASYYVGDTFYIVAFAILAAVSGTAGLLRRLWRHWRK
jgi:hypothetical protein